MIKPLKIGVGHAGGLGDNLDLSAVIPTIKRKFPNSEITLFVTRFPQIFDSHPLVKEVITIHGPVYQKRIDLLRDTFDLFFETRYAGKVHFSKRALQFTDVLAYKKLHEKAFKKYKNSFDHFLGDIKYTVNLNESVNEMLCNSLALKGTTDSMAVYLNLEHFKASEAYDGLKTAVICNSASGGIQTKNWHYDSWGKVLYYLKTVGITPIQLGTPDEESLHGIDRFFGSVHETAALIKKSEFFIGIEGGLARLAYTVGTPGIVLYGPTYEHMFKLPNQITIRSGACTPCLWKNTQWMTYCERLKEKIDYYAPPCMMGINEKQVIEAIQETVRKKYYD